MDLRIFFDPVKIEQSNDPSLFSGNIKTFKEDFPSLEAANIAIIGVGEERGTLTNKGCAQGPDEVRLQLYKLKKGTGSTRIIDLGNLRPGEMHEDTCLRLKEVIEMLMQQEILPLIIGGSHDLDYGQFLAYEHTEKLISILNVDAALDMASTQDDKSKSHINNILVYQPNFIFNYSHLAYHSYLTDQEAVNVLEKLYFETYRVGRVRENIEDMEPVIRDADMLSFDIGAIRISDAPGNKNAASFGLTGEEACQICWYAGLSSKLSSAGFYEYNPGEDFRRQTAGVVATMIWYFIEGYSSRKGNLKVDNPNYTKFIVEIDSEYQKLIFYKNNLTEKWWMEVPYPDTKKKFARNSIVPCSYNDYLAANKGEVPDRWILTHSKLI